MSSPTVTAKDEMTTGRVVETSEGSVTLAIPGSSYKIKLTCDDDLSKKNSNP